MDQNAFATSIFKARAHPLIRKLRWEFLCQVSTCTSGRSIATVS
jgi:hypothetical protein